MLSKPCAFFAPVIPKVVMRVNGTKEIWASMLCISSWFLPARFTCRTCLYRFLQTFRIKNDLLLVFVNGYLLLCRPNPFKIRARTVPGIKYPELSVQSDWGNNRNSLAQFRFARVKKPGCLVNQLRLVFLGFLVVKLCLRPGCQSMPMNWFTKWVNSWVPNYLNHLRFFKIRLWQVPL